MQIPDSVFEVYWTCTHNPTHRSPTRTIIANIVQLFPLFTSASTEFKLIPHLISFPSRLINKAAGVLVPIADMLIQQNSAVDYYQGNQSIDI